MSPPSSDATELVRRRVINVVGHELRTPITTVRGLAELLVDADEREAREVIIPALIRNARRTEHLLDDLLLVSEVETAYPVDEPIDVDLRELVQSVAGPAGFRVDGDPEAPAVAHPELARRALQHLVSNAARYHSDDPWIAFESDATTVTVVVVTPVDSEVRDVELSFEVFFRGESAVTRSAGLGIGLPAARALARADGGDVEIESSPTQFVARLRLPRAQEST